MYVCMYICNMYIYIHNRVTRWKPSTIDDTFIFYLSRNKYQSKSVVLFRIHISICHFTEMYK